MHCSSGWIRRSRRLLQKTAQRVKEIALRKKVRQYDLLESELSATKVAIGRAEGVLSDFVKRVCTGYTALVCAQASHYPDRLNAVLGDAQSRGEYLGGYRVCVGDDGLSLHVYEADSV